MRAANMANDSYHLMVRIYDTTLSPGVLETQQNSDQITARVANLTASLTSINTTLVDVMTSVEGLERSLESMFDSANTAMEQMLLKVDILQEYTNNATVVQQKTISVASEAEKYQVISVLDKVIFE